jgi:hypothetical protein
MRCGGIASRPDETAATPLRPVLNTVEATAAAVLLLDEILFILLIGPRAGPLQFLIATPRHNDLI